MTCIAWDGKTLAADKRASYGITITTVTKIRRINGLLVGGSGETSFIGMMLDWIEKGRDPAAFPKTQQDKDDWQPILVIELDGSTSLYERTAHPIRHEQQHIAIGSGREFAMAAMHLGCTARAAVEVAIALDCGCGNGIDVLDRL
jgi:ATP-dependent protease HslVU (ClpYQ) peptidase subunit